MKMMLLFTLLFSSVIASANDNQIKSYFLKSGKKLVRQLEGQIDSEVEEKLKQNLKWKFIKVSQEQLIDNRGSIVDAIGEINSVTLNQKVWQSYLNKKQNVDLLVLHELLRMSGVNDDDYIVSLELIQLLHKIEEKKVYCDLNENNFKEVSKLTQYKITTSSSAEANGHGVILSFNTVTEDSPYKKLRKKTIKNAKAFCRGKGHTQFHKVISFGKYKVLTEEVNGFQTTGYFLDAYIHCVDKKYKKRKNEIVKKEICKKVNSCIDRVNRLERSSLLEEQLDELLEMKQKNNCRNI